MHASLQIITTLSSLLSIELFTLAHGKKPVFFLTKIRKETNTQGTKPVLYENKYMEHLTHRASLTSWKSILSRDLGPCLQAAFLILNQCADLGLQFKYPPLFSGCKSEKIVQCISSDSPRYQLKGWHKPIIPKLSSENKCCLENQAKKAFLMEKFRIQTMEICTKLGHSKKTSLKPRAHNVKTIQLITKFCLKMQAHKHPACPLLPEKRVDPLTYRTKLSFSKSKNGGLGAQFQDFPP